jgi:hypothetical protein
MGNFVHGEFCVGNFVRLTLIDAICFADAPLALSIGRFPEPLFTRALFLSQILALASLVCHADKRRRQEVAAITIANEVFDRGVGQIDFRIKATGDFRNLLINIALNAAGGDFEDRTWKHVLGNVAKECEKQ